MILSAVAVVGGGRVGQSLARALVHSGVPVAVLSRAARTLAAPLGEAMIEWDAAIGSADVVILAVPDDALPAVAERLAVSGAVAGRHVVLHCSGVRDRSALAVLDRTGAALGSWHSLIAFGGSRTALRGVPAILEGDAGAVRAARALAERIGMAPVMEIEAGAKTRYHAAAVFASNYLVVLAAMAERLAESAGLGSGVALFGPLLRSAVEETLAQGPVGALTGPIRRGDVATVEAHLAALDEPTRELYLALGREALALAERGGLGAAAAGDLRRVLAG